MNSATKYVPRGSVAVGAKNLKLVQRIFICRLCGVQIHANGTADPDTIRHLCRSELAKPIPIQPANTFQLCEHLGNELPDNQHFTCPGCGGGTYATFHCHHFNSPAIPFLQGNRRTAEARKQRFNLCQSCPHYQAQSNEESTHKTPTSV